jgi:hypothetical protein
MPPCRGAASLRPSLPDVLNLDLYKKVGAGKKISQPLSAQFHFFLELKT